MPVPPQESAPSLSPRQSFGCQSPLPWVTGTDRTGILRALWQLQGSFQEFSSPSAHSLTWRSRSQANKPHAVQYCVVTTIHRKHRQCFQKRFSNHWMISRHDFGTGSTHRLAQPFHQPQGFFHWSSTQGISVKEMRSQDCLERMQTHSSGQGIHGFPQANTA
jgi:hypothetical protein